MHDILEKFDRTMRQWAGLLHEDLDIPIPEARAFATTVHGEVSRHARRLRAELLAVSPVPLEERRRVLLLSLLPYPEVPDEGVGAEAAVVRDGLAHAMITHKLYVSFAYVGDSLFDVLGKFLPATTTSYKTAKYLRSGKCREFRNAFAHGNWQLQSGTFHYWPRVTLDGGELRIVPERASLEDILFWSSLSGALAFSCVQAATH